jgi:hypothetical protein
LTGGCFAGTNEKLALVLRRCYAARMAKYDPIISEFESEEAEAGYDKWFREQVEEGLRSEGPWIPHEQVMKEARAIVERAKSKIAHDASSSIS